MNKLLIFALVCSSTFFLGAAIHKLNISGMNEALVRAIKERGGDKITGAEYDDGRKYAKVFLGPDMYAIYDDIEIYAPQIGRAEYKEGYRTIGIYDKRDGAYEVTTGQLWPTSFQNASKLHEKLFGISKQD